MDDPLEWFTSLYDRYYLNVLRYALQHAEQGYAEAQVTPWFGIVVPAATPQAIVARIDAALETALASPEVREKLDTAGCEARSAPIGQFADIIKSDIALWARVVKEAGIPTD